ncbi:endonuclease domain-containing protein [Microbacterium sp. HA-8]|uniref:endonuclease domain-containing protein n=1 Tax=Microbacterium sp. HA-8 TaxID=3234200 RepID=UPI0038F76BBD
MFDMHPDRLYVHADLKSAGLSQRRITGMVRGGGVARPRQGVYVHPDSSLASLSAAHVGGLVTCITLLSELGVFVLEREGVHVQVPPHATRLRTKAGVRLHWTPLHRTPPPSSLRVEVFDALLQATLCQPPRAALATLDSALHLGLIDEDDLDELFRHIPRRRRALRALVDGRCESGPETFVRLLLRALGLTFECQVEIPGVGRVDFVVEGWLIIECDSRAHHSGWEAQAADRRRDLAAAALGYATIRPVAADILADTPALGRVIVGMAQRIGLRVHNTPEASVPRPRSRRIRA